MTDSFSVLGQGRGEKDSARSQQRDHDLEVQTAALAFRTHTLYEGARYAVRLASAERRIETMQEASGAATRALLLDVQTGQPLAISFGSNPNPGPALAGLDGCPEDLQQACGILDAPMLLPNLMADVRVRRLLVAASAMSPEEVQDAFPYKLSELDLLDELTVEETALEATVFWAKHRGNARSRPPLTLQELGLVKQRATDGSIYSCLTAAGVRQQERQRALQPSRTLPEARRA